MIHDSGSSNHESEIKNHEWLRVLLSIADRITGYSKSSTVASAAARPTISATGSAASADSTSANRERVSGLRGVKSVQQSWSGMMEIGYVPSRDASAVISSLSIPMTGRKTGRLATFPMTERF